MTRRPWFRHLAVPLAAFGALLGFFYWLSWEMAAAVAVVGVPVAVLWGLELMRRDEGAGDDA
jgi:hypothetical protein